MPPVETYAIRFANFNLVPHIDLRGWGPMQQGLSPDAQNASNWSDYAGLNLYVERSPTAADVASNSMYLIFRPDRFVLENRFIMRLEFDVPLARGFPSGMLNTWGPPPSIEPWAVGLGVKFGGKNDLPTDRKVVVTCQFNSALDGVRLNTPDALQKDKPAVLDSPLDYARYQRGNKSALLDKLFPPIRFVLEHAFAGYNGATIGHTAGSGTLAITERTTFWNAATKTDHRVFSNAGLAKPGETETSIGAIGFALVSSAGVGLYTVRVRSFSVFVIESA